MIRLDISEVQANLGRYLDELQPGETIILSHRDEPVVELRRLPSARSKLRPFGLDRGKFTVPASFFEPLPENVLTSFEGALGNNSPSNRSQARFRQQFEPARSDE